MFTSRNSFLILAATALVLPFAAFADPLAKPDKRKVLGLDEYIKILKVGTRAEQVDAAEAVRDFYPGRCIDALPQMVASLGRELDIPYDTPNDKGRAGYLAQRIGEAAQTMGPERFKTLFEMTTDKDTLVRAAAFRLLYYASDEYQKGEGSKEKSELDLSELLKVAKKGAKDDSPTVRGQVMIALRAFSKADTKLSVPAAELLAESLEDREEIKNKYHAIPAAQAASTLIEYGENAKPAFRALLKAISHEDKRYADSCCIALGRFAKTDPKMAEESLKHLRELLTDSKRDASVRRSAAWGIREMGRVAKPAIPELANVLEEPEIGLQLREFLYDTLDELGPTSVGAVPTLISRLEKSSDRREQIRVLYTLAEIGPAAEKAVIAVEQWAKTVPEKDKDMRDAVTATLARIK